MLKRDYIKIMSMVLILECWDFTSHLDSSDLSGAVSLYLWSGLGKSQVTGKSRGTEKGTD